MVFDFATTTSSDDRRFFSFIPPPLTLSPDRRKQSLFLFTIAISHYTSKTPRRVFATRFPFFTLPTRTRSIQRSSYSVCCVCVKKKRISVVYRFYISRARAPRNKNENFDGRFSPCEKDLREFGFMRLTRAYHRRVVRVSRSAVFELRFTAVVFATTN